MASQRIGTLDAHLVTIESSLRIREVLLQEQDLMLREQSILLNNHSAKLSLLITSVGDITKSLTALHVEIREGFQQRTYHSHGALKSSDQDKAILTQSNISGSSLLKSEQYYFNNKCVELSPLHGEGPIKWVSQTGADFTMEGTTLGKQVSLPQICMEGITRLENESQLIQYPSKEGKQFKLNNIVSKVIPGQQRVTFKREYLSFSLKCNTRSLDLICEDKDEDEIRFFGPKALITQGGNCFWWRFKSKSESVHSDSSRFDTQIFIPLITPFDPGDTDQVAFRNSSQSRWRKAFTDMISFTTASKSSSQDELITTFGSMDSSSNRNTTSEIFQVSLSNAILQLWLVIQDLSLVITGATVVVLLVYTSFKFTNFSIFILLVLTINICGCIGVLSTLSSSIRIERVWLLGIFESQIPELLIKVKSVTRDIDLSCQLLSPIIIGFMILFVSLKASAIILAYWNTVSVWVEFWFFTSVSNVLLALDQSSQKKMTRPLQSDQEMNNTTLKGDGLLSVTDDNSELEDNNSTLMTATSAGDLTATDVFTVEWIHTNKIHFGLAVSYYGFVNDVLEHSEKYQKCFGPLWYFVVGFLKFLCSSGYEIEYLPASIVG